MRLPTRLLLALALAFLQGCATPVFVPPDSGKTATLTLDSTARYGDLSLFTFKDSASCSGRQILGSSTEVGSTVMKSRTRIPVDQPFVIELSMRRGVYTCEALTAFDPSADRHYELHIDSDEKHCYLRVRDVTGGFPHPEPTHRQMRWASTAFRDGPCEVVPDGQHQPRGRASGKVTLDDLKGLMPAK